MLLPPQFSTDDDKAIRSLIHEIMSLKFQHVTNLISKTATNFIVPSCTIFQLHFIIISTLGLYFSSD